jgi:hypothetical protein
MLGNLLHLLKALSVMFLERLSSIKLKLEGAGYGIISGGFMI